MFIKGALFLYYFVTVNFLIPYLLAVLVIGIPAMFLEVSLGQYTSAGLFGCWEFAPVFKGKTAN